MAQDDVSSSEDEDKTKAARQQVAWQDEPLKVVWDAAVVGKKKDGSQEIRLSYILADKSSTTGLHVPHKIDKSSVF